MNTQLGSGKVHAAIEDSKLPKCGGNKAAERYRHVFGEVTCTKCIKILAEEAAETAAVETVETAPVAETVETVETVAAPAATVAAPAAPASAVQVTEMTDLTDADVTVDLDMVEPTKGLVTVKVGRQVVGGTILNDAARYGEPGAGWSAEDEVGHVVANHRRGAQAAVKALVTALGFRGRVSIRITREYTW